MRDRYRVDRLSFERHFPEHFPVPALLNQFARWLESRPYGSVGYFECLSERFNDFWATDSADLHENFAFFLKDPTGGHIGFWLYDGADREDPPVVHVGSEGETEVIADNLGLFLHKLAEGETGLYDLDETEDDVVSAREELSAFVQENVTDLIADHAAEYPDFGEWIQRFQDSAESRKDSDAVLLEIAQRLRKYRRPGADEWDTDTFEVVLVGGTFAIWRRHFGLKQLPADETRELEPLFRQAREARARTFPDRGLWLQASVSVGAAGGAWLRCDFLSRPTIDGQPFEIPAEDLEADFSAWPRSAHWKPEWC